MARSRSTGPASRRPASRQAAVAGLLLGAAATLIALASPAGAAEPVTRVSMPGIGSLHLPPSAMPTGPGLPPVAAGNPGADLSGAELCEREIARVERAYQFPTDYLLALGRVEAGRAVQTPRGPEVRVWPWAVNADGAAYYFPSRRHAIEGVRLLQQRGARFIDVGCMQIDLHYHPSAFRSLDEAFDPAINIEYGAFFLLTLRERTGSWTTAYAHYHNPKDPAKQADYVCRIHQRWTELQRRRAPSSETTAEATSTAAGFCDGRPGTRLAAFGPGRAAPARPEIMTADDMRRARALAALDTDIMILSRGVWRQLPTASASLLEPSAAPPSQPAPINRNLRP